jgi:methylenetetrahydrofolate dehydrogenase (NADP+) / methenyltetrahydrofolate cyclohydrolase
MAARIIDGKAIAAKIRSDLKSKVGTYAAQSGRTPHLVVVLANDDPASAIYVRNKGKAAEEVGIRSSQHTLDPKTSKDALLELIARLNTDPDIDGILVQLPLPKQHETFSVLMAIDPSKDVDGFHPVNAGRLARGDEGGLLPCTPAGCVRLIEESGTKIAGKRAVVVGRSSIVGRPMSELLLNRHATVTVCHSKTNDLPEVIAEAELLIAAIGKPEMIKGAWVRPGATVIDVGVNKKPDGKLTGDVAFFSARERAGAITPVPGGVGPMTIALLLENTLRAATERAKRMAR